MQRLGQVILAFISRKAEKLHLQQSKSKDISSFKLLKSIKDIMVILLEEERNIVAQRTDLIREK